LENLHIGSSDILLSVVVELADARLPVSMSEVKESIPSIPVFLINGKAIWIEGTDQSEN
jgi:hypothetical protein